MKQVSPLRTKTKPMIGRQPFTRPRQEPKRRRMYPNLVLIVLPLVVLSTVGLIATIPLIEGQAMGVVDLALGQRGTPRPSPAPTAQPVILSAQLGRQDRLPFHSVALGVTLDYPLGWRKKETTLQVLFAPSPDGLTPDAFTNSSLRVGISNDEEIDDPAAVLAEVLAIFPSNARTIGRETLLIAGQPWQSHQVRFAEAGSERQSLALVAVTSHNGVGYFLAAVAPVEEWDSIQPLFQEMIDSFRFVVEAELPPTPDGTLPPTPTATPTPIIYIVQPGDTLMGIALEYGVDMNALADRNDIGRPESLRSGQRLVIPRKRK